MVNSLGIYFNDFFNKYLPLQKNSSKHTIRSYKNTFELFLNYSKDTGIEVAKISLDIFAEKRVLNFLDYLEDERKNSINTRNQRLAVISSFINFIYLKEPDKILEFQKILNIPFKRHEEAVIEYLTVDELKVFLSIPDISNKRGRRDLTLLSVLYDTGARVSEFVNIKVSDVRICNNEANIQLFGKGSKSRIVPIISNTVELLKNYMDENNLAEKLDKYLFTNNSNRKLSTSGITYIIEKYRQFSLKILNTFPKKLSPHCMRHTKAMHLLESNIPLVYIANFLGHANIKTTEIYAKMSVEEKRKVLNNVYNEKDDATNIECSWNKDEKLLDYLMKL